MARLKRLLVAVLRTRPVRSLMKKVYPRFVRIVGTREGAIALSYYAGQAIAEERWRDAIDLAELAIAADPTWAGGHRMLGRAYRGSGEPLRARAAYQEGERLAPDDYEGAWDLGDLELALGRDEAVEAAYRRAVALDPDNPVLLTKLAQAVGAQHRIDEAAALLERASRLAPGDAQTLRLLGMARYEQGDSLGAVSLLTDAIERERGHSLSHFYLALALADLGRHQGALAAARRAAALDPDDERYRALEAQLAEWADHPRGPR